MKTWTIFVFLIAFAQTLVAQEEVSKYDFSPCGTLPEKDRWLADYLEYGIDMPDNADDTLYVGMQLHLLANNSGNGRFSPEKLLNSICRLNTDFAPAAIQFYCKYDWNLLNNSAWYQHDSIAHGVQMMFANNVPDVLNAYFVAKAAGSCGYNLPYAGVAMMHVCSGPDDHTWTHEVGHALKLPHTFRGWDYNLYDPNSPTPDTLTYNYTYFHDTLDTTIPAPLDTALVEYVDGSNCGIAADNICDTKPDYLSYRWDCNTQGNSLVVQKDPAGATFVSDGSLYMSYADDKCQNRFSEKQTEIMRAHLLTKKASWVVFDAQHGPVEGTPVLLSPINEQSAPATGALLQWSRVPGATHYVVQASRLASFAIKEVELVVNDTFATIDPLQANVVFNWRVRPFNYSYACTSFSPAQKFKAVTVSVHKPTEIDGWRCYPTLLESGQPLSVEIPAGWLNHSGHFSVYDASGRFIWQTEHTFNTRVNTLNLPSATWNSGIYFLTCSGPTGVARQTVVLQSE